MKILQVYAKNCLNGKQLVIDENATEEDFVKTIVNEHTKHYYHINKIDLNIEDEGEYLKQWGKIYRNTLDKCIEYAREHKINYFGDYEIVLLDDEKGIESPDIIDTYTFYEMENKAMTDCRNCESKQNCVVASERIQQLNDYDKGVIKKDDNGYEINPYNIYNGCEDYNYKDVEEIKSALDIKSKIKTKLNSAKEFENKIINNERGI